MAILNIPTKSTGDTFTATELNTIVEAIQENQRETGWAQYTATNYTSGSPLSISQGATEVIENNAGSTITSHLPYGVTSLYDETLFKITPQNIGDAYLIRVDFKAYTSSPSGLAEIQLNIGGAQGVISRRKITFPKGTGSSNFISDSFTTAIHSLDTFVANGGQLQVESFTGITSIYDINFVIFRTHKANV